MEVHESYSNLNMKINHLRQMPNIIMFCGHGRPPKPLPLKNFEQAIPSPSLRLIRVVTQREKNPPRSDHYRPKPNTWECQKSRRVQKKRNGQSQKKKKGCVKISDGDGIKSSDGKSEKSGGKSGGGYVARDGPALFGGGGVASCGGGCLAGGRGSGRAEVRRGAAVGRGVAVQARAGVHDFGVVQV